MGSSPGRATFGRTSAGSSRNINLRFMAQLSWWMGSDANVNCWPQL
jgi:hypothetical protein